MSQFSELVKQAVIRRDRKGRFSSWGQAYGNANYPQPENMKRHARKPNHPANRAPKPKPPANLADMLTKRWGEPKPHASGGKFNALTGKIENITARDIGAGVRKGALSWMEGKAVPALLAGTGGVGAAVVGKEYVTPWITKKLSPKQTLMQKLMKSPVARKLLLAGGGAAALGGGIALGESAHKRVSDEVGKRRAFQKLLKHSPQLAKQDPKHTAELFNALYTFNKDLAKNPLTASSFIKTRLHYKEEGLQPTDIKTLVEIGSHKQKAKPKDSFLGKTFGQSASLSGMAGLGIGAPPVVPK
jgi:hypothetical protein